MQTVTDYYATLGTAATPEQARGLRQPPSDEAARAEMMGLDCTMEEIAAVLAQLPFLDGRYRESRFVGIVAALRGSWTGLPTRGPLFEWEWYHLWEGGACEKRAQYGEWLREVLMTKETRYANS